MINAKSLVAAALLSALAVTSFAQAPAASAPATGASMPMHQKKKPMMKEHKKAKVEAPAAAASK